MKTILASSIISILALIALGLYTKSIDALVIAVILAVLEISLSFDNAVINAKILVKMDETWQRRFIYIGLPIAVFGMRLVFPVVLVALTTPLGLMDVASIAIHNPLKYQQALMTGYPLISGFGGAFLLMVFMNFFLDHEREVKWLVKLESHKWVQKVAHFPLSSLIITLIIGLLLASYVQSVGFVIAFGTGAILNFILHFFQQKLNTTGLVNAGLMGFIYLEILDASFSMDGVIGAFAMTYDIFIIMVGLGIGAFFVRSFTLVMVKHQTLKKWLYLEHGAHYAIGFLACVMFFNLYHHVPELITAGVSVLILLLAFKSSFKK